MWPSNSREVNDHKWHASHHTTLVQMGGGYVHVVVGVLLDHYGIVGGEREVVLRHDDVLIHNVVLRFIHGQE